MIVAAPSVVVDVLADVSAAAVGPLLKVKDVDHGNGYERDGNDSNLRKNQKISQDPDGTKYPKLDVLNMFWCFIFLMLAPLRMHLLHFIFKNTSY